MRVIGLISGGKDSIFNMMQCVAAGHKVVAVGNIEPIQETSEMDSYMYQTVGQEVISLIAEALQLPLYREKTKGKAICQDKLYSQTLDDEVEDLYNLLSKAKADMDIEGVSVGAIASDYQRTRVENVCERLGLKVLGFLWGKDQAELLQSMIDSGVEAIIVKVACLGLKPDVHLGMTIKEIQPYVTGLHDKYGVNVCGEGGEYETLTLDCPLFHRRIRIVQSEKVTHSNDALTPVCFLHVIQAVLEPKPPAVS